MEERALFPKMANDMLVGMDLLKLKDNLLQSNIEVFYFFTCGILAYKSSFAKLPLFQIDAIDEKQME